MNKAFVKENDEDIDEDDLPEPPSGTGGRNYISPSGYRRLQEELRQLQSVERPKVVETVAWAAGNGDRSENADYQYGKRRLREIDRRVRFLNKQLRSAEVIDPCTQKSDQVLFGATVTILDEADRQKTYVIVGVDEVDLSKGRISWVSPIGAALLRNKVGDVVAFRSPKGVQEVEIISLSYLEIE